MYAGFEKTVALNAQSNIAKIANFEAARSETKSCTCYCQLARLQRREQRSGNGAAEEAVGSSFVLFNWSTV